MDGQQIGLMVLKGLQEKKSITDQGLQGKALQEIGKDMGHDLSKELQKTMDILLNPEHSQDQIPYHLSQKSKHRKKKRKLL